MQLIDNSFIVGYILGNMTDEIQPLKDGKEIVVVMGVGFVGAVMADFPVTVFPISILTNATFSFFLSISSTDI